jgi:hypothetical protein
MPRGESIGGIDPDIKDEFKIRKIRGRWKNYSLLLERMIVLYDRYNDEYTKELEKVP